MKRLLLTVAAAFALTAPTKAQESLTFVKVPVSGEDLPATAIHGSVGTFAFRGAPRCGGDGTVLVVPLNQGGQAASRVVRLDRAGRRTVVDLTRVIEGAKTDFQILAVALDDAGTLHALVDLGDRARRPPRKIVAVSPDGTSRWERDLDESGIHVKDFAVLANGDVLLVGLQPPGKGAVTALLHREGGQSAVRALPPGQDAGTLAAVSGANGAFVVDDRNDRVVQIGRENTVVGQFALARPSPQARLIGAQMAGGRIAALYAEMTQPGEGVRRFVSLQNVANGGVVRTLGPFATMVVCYSAPEQRDEVTLLSTTRTGWVLMRGR
jgi:hypothetical protein